MSDITKEYIENNNFIEYHEYPNGEIEYAHLEFGISVTFNGDICTEITLDKDTILKPNKKKLMATIEFMKLIEELTNENN